MAEAKRKAEEAKKLTKLWRTAKTPRPSREWVVDELERLNVRIISVRRRSIGEMKGEKSQPGKEIRRVSYADSDISDVSDDDDDDEERDGPTCKRARTLDAIDVGEVDPFMARRSSVNLIASILNDTDFDKVASIPGFDTLFDEGNMGTDTAITRSETSRPAPNAVFNLLPTVENDPSDEKQDHNMTMMGDLHAYSSPDRACVSPIGRERTHAASTSASSRTLLDMVSGSTTDTACAVAAPASFKDMSHYKMLQVHHVNLVEELEKTTALLDLYQKEILLFLKKE